MTDNTVQYTTEWNRITRRPIAGHTWIDEARARDLYDGMKGLDVVDAETVDDTGVPVQRWVLGIGTSGRIRASFFTLYNTIWRQVDWNWIDGRLWRWTTVDYTYPTQDRKWRQGEATSTVQSTVLPDGTGHLLTVDPAKPRDEQRHYADLIGRSSDTYWLDRPVFGDWAALADPGPSAYEVAGFDRSARAM